ncbi:class II aldolase/adducin family protein [Desulfovibrio sp. OttesenSCG-928-I05]|nr:class II aldolase/adducin family protein [Desulfovibrio sp. OttesenSCG-928-I05]
MAASPLSWPQDIPADAAEAIRETCRDAWKRELLSGFNGNVSLRVHDGSVMLITRSGAAKGYLAAGDLCLVRIADGTLLAGGKPSSEGGMHLEIYREQPEARAIVHTHPPRLLALGALLPAGNGAERRLDLPVYEAQTLRESLTILPDYLPGTQELAQAAGIGARTHKALWMERHGLAVWAENLTAALALSEELEHLAGIQLHTLRGESARC